MLAFRSASRSVTAPICRWGLGLRAFSDVPTKKKTIQQLAKEISLKNQPVLVRADLNLPRSKEDGSIVDDTRARAVSVLIGVSTSAIVLSSNKQGEVAWYCRSSVVL